MQINHISHFNTLSFYKDKIDRMTNDSITSKEISNHRILIINANEYSQDIQSQFLDEIGFTQIDFSDQDNQLDDVINNQQYSIIIFEFLTFNEKSLAICNAIRNSLKNKNAILLAATYIKDDTFDKCIEFGMSGLIIKPFIFGMYKKALCFYLSRLMANKIKSIY